MKVLYIKANPKANKESASSSVAEKFIESYRRENPSDIIDTVDLYKENWPHLGVKDLDDYKNENGSLKTISKKFASYDKYIFSAPMWNLAIPSILKAYFDFVVVSGVTFKYTKYGIPLGLLKNKKAICIIARGGSYDYWPMSLFGHDKKYLKVVLKFMGIKNVEFLTIENLNKDINNYQKIIDKATIKAGKLAQKF